ncbi:MAG: class I SAM-dependent methyltransferase [Promethearchaeota archaeon]
MTKITNSFKKKQEIIKNYNLTSHFYDQRYSQIQTETFEILLNNLELNQKKILDAGCGTGLLLEFINSLKQNSTVNYHYIGMDITLNMLKEFQSKPLTKKMQWKVNLILADIESLPFRENIFDIIFSITSFQNLPNLTKGIKETLRVGQDKGEVRFSILKKKLKIEQLNTLLKSLFTNLKLIQEEFLEDIIFVGKILKV